MSLATKILQGENKIPRTVIELSLSNSFSQHVKQGFHNHIFDPFGHFNYPASSLYEQCKGKEHLGISKCEG